MEIIVALLIYAALLWGTIRFIAVCTRNEKED